MVGCNAKYLSILYANFFMKLHLVAYQFFINTIQLPTENRARSNSHLGEGIFPILGKFARRWIIT